MLSGVPSANGWCAGLSQEGRAAEVVFSKRAFQGCNFGMLDEMKMMKYDWFFMVDNRYFSAGPCRPHLWLQGIMSLGLEEAPINSFKTNGRMIETFTYLGTYRTSCQEVSTSSADEFKSSRSNHGIKPPSEHHRHHHHHHHHHQQFPKTFHP